MPTDRAARYVQLPSCMPRTVPAWATGGIAAFVVAVVSGCGTSGSEDETPLGVTPGSGGSASGGSGAVGGSGGSAAGAGPIACVESLDRLHPLTGASAADGGTLLLGGTQSL